MILDHIAIHPNFPKSPHEVLPPEYRWFPADEALRDVSDLGVIIREIDKLIVINDEAHHIHDSRLAWFKSIQDIHNCRKKLMRP